MLGRLRDQWTKDSLAGQLFARWDFSDQFFGIIDLRRFNLFGANLSGANLFEADLRGADLRGANLFGADLRGANLFGADLGEANLGGADCSRLHIDSARLQSADLSGAVNLAQEQIDQAYGNSKTKLPKGMAIREDRLRED